MVKNNIMTIREFAYKTLCLLLDHVNKISEHRIYTIPNNFESAKYIITDLNEIIEHCIDTISHDGLQIVRNDLYHNDINPDLPIMYIYTEHFSINGDFICDKYHFGLTHHNIYDDSKLVQLHGLLTYANMFKVSFYYGKKITENKKEYEYINKLIN